VIVRAPVPSDAREIRRIAWENNLPVHWHWPPGKHGLVVEHDGRLLAFTIIYESVYGLVIDELWEEQSKDGFRGLSVLSKHLEGVAQRLADERDEPLMIGGVVRMDKERHRAALRNRDYTVEAEVLGKLFLPKRLHRAT
jgi:hypothetical protein